MRRRAVVPNAAGVHEGLRLSDLWKRKLARLVQEMAATYRVGRILVTPSGRVDINGNTIAFVPEGTSTASNRPERMADGPPPLVRNMLGAVSRAQSYMKRMLVTAASRGAYPLLSKVRNTHKPEWMRLPGVSSESPPSTRRRSRTKYPVRNPSHANDTAMDRRVLAYGVHAGNKVGQGGFGTVWAMVATPHLHRLMDSLEYKVPRVPRVPIGERVAVKFQLAGTQDNLERAIVKKRLGAAMFVRIERAIVSMWRAGVAHVDLNPNNIIVRPNGTVTIIDFGISETLPRALVPKSDKAAMDLAYQDRLLEFLGHKKAANKMNRAALDPHVLRWLYWQVHDKKRVGALRA